MLEGLLREVPLYTVQIVICLQLKSNNDVILCSKSKVK